MALALGQYVKRWQRWVKAGIGAWVTPQEHMTYHPAWANSWLIIPSNLDIVNGGLSQFLTCCDKRHIRRMLLCSIRSIPSATTVGV